MASANGMFQFNGLTVVGKRSTQFEGQTYFYVTFSNGEKLAEFSVDADSYASFESFGTYSGSCDFVNKKLKLAGVAKSK